ncbi:Zn-ribbon domain-containing OB-fold protein [Nocardia pseudovaccinii]|uniref:Zn-ribbon domain-containing OB-fold protein n=1 Tax=Nocardia pseudovaccinii TaxID=189540 RepID=UPI003D918241
MNTTAPPEPKPVPVTDHTSRPFWDACREHRLVVQRCNNCRRWRWTPSPVCPGCQSWSAEWEQVPGTGRVASFVVLHRAFHAAFTGDVPYVVAHVRLDGCDNRAVMISNLVDCPVEVVSVDMEVEVLFEDRDEVTVPLFRPSRTGQSHRGEGPQ